MSTWLVSLTAVPPPNKTKMTRPRERIQDEMSTFFSNSLPNKLLISEIQKYDTQL